MFKYVEAKDEELIKEIYRFRCQIACDELKILNREDYPDGLETDEYDKYSIHLAILNENDEVVSCLRLIYNSAIGYPTQNEMVIEKDISFIESGKLGEISRIFIHSRYRDMRSTKVIIESLKKEVCKKMIELDIEYSFGALEKSFHRLLRILNMPYEIVGKKQMHGGRMRYPAILSTQKLIEVNHYFNELMEENV